MLNLTVLVSGGGTNLQALIDAEAEGKLRNTKIVKVISSKKDAYALERAKKSGISSVVIEKKEYSDEKAFGEALVEAAEKAQTDLVVLAGYLVVLPEEFVDRYENRIVNIHPSLIPSFCGKGFYGLKVHEDALRRGVRITGATVHFVDKGCDTGPIILQKAVEVRFEDTPQSLQKRVMEQAEWQILPEAVSLIAENRVRIEDGKVRIDGKK